MVSALACFKNWMLILVLLCENERQRWDASRYIKARSEAILLFILYFLISKNWIFWYIKKSILKTYIPFLDIKKSIFVNKEIDFFK